MSRSPLPDAILARHFRGRPEPGRDDPGLARIQPYPASVLVRRHPSGWLAIAPTRSRGRRTGRPRLHHPGVPPCPDTDAAR